MFHKSRRHVQLSILSTKTKTHSLPREIPFLDTQWWESTYVTIERVCLAANIRRRKASQLLDLPYHFWIRSQTHNSNMKVITALTLVGAASAFAPQEVGRASTQQNALFDDVSFSFQVSFRD